MTFLHLGRKLSFSKVLPAERFSAGSRPFGSSVCGKVRPKAILVLIFSFPLLPDKDSPNLLNPVVMMI